MKQVRRISFVLTLIAGTMLLVPTQKAQAAVPIAKIIKEAIKKVVKAVDLMIQRLQNETIALQNAAKVLENELSKLKLNEIAEWTEKQRQLYKEYFDELWRVRNTIAMYERVKNILQRQAQLAKEYKSTWQIIKEDKRFTESELDYIYKVYTGILNESVRNLDQVQLAINSFKMQMTDAARLEVIARAGERIERNYTDLRQFNDQNIRLSINRAKDIHEAESVRKLYGIEIK